MSALDAPHVLARNVPGGRGPIVRRSRSLITRGDKELGDQLSFEATLRVGRRPGRRRVTFCRTGSVGGHLGMSAAAAIDAAVPANGGHLPCVGVEAPAG